MDGNTDVQVQLQAMQAQLAQVQAYMPIYFQVYTVLIKSRTFLAVMAGVVVFNHFVTLPHEIRYVWRAKPSWLNACLMASRYGIIAEFCTGLYLLYYPRGSFDTCRRVFRAETYLPSTVLIFGNILLIVRTYALWQRNKIVLGGMVCLLLAVTAIHIWVPIKASAMELPTGIRDLNIPDIRGCVPSRHIEHWWLVFTASTVFDAVAFILSIIPCLTEYRASTQSGIARIIVRDGVLFFALCLGANLANLIYFACAGPMDNPGLLAALATGMQAIAAARLIFNLRSASHSARNSLLGTGRSGRLQFSEGCSFGAAVPTGFSGHDSSGSGGKRLSTIPIPPFSNSFTRDTRHESLDVDEKGENMELKGCGV